MVFVFSLFGKNVGYTRYTTQDVSLCLLFCPKKTSKKGVDRKKNQRTQGRVEIDVESRPEIHSWASRSYVKYTLL